MGIPRPAGHPQGADPPTFLINPCLCWGQPCEAATYSYFSFNSFGCGVQGRRTGTDLGHPLVAQGGRRPAVRVARHSWGSLQSWYVGTSHLLRPSVRCQPLSSPPPLPLLFLSLLIHLLPLLLILPLPSNSPLPLSPLSLPSCPSSPTLPSSSSLSPQLFPLLLSLPFPSTPPAH